MTKLHIAIHKANAWQIRIAALSFLVLGIGSGSQFLVNAFAAGTEPEIQNVQTTTSIFVIPTTISASHLHVRRAGVHTVGGYTVTIKK